MPVKGVMDERKDGFPGILVRLWTWRDAVSGKMVLVAFVWRRLRAAGRSGV